MVRPIPSPPADCTAVRRAQRGGPGGVLRNYNASKALNLLDFGSPGWIFVLAHTGNVSNMAEQKSRYFAVM